MQEKREGLHVPGPARALDPQEQLHLRAHREPVCRQPTYTTFYIVRNLAFNLWHSSKYFQFSSCKFRFQKDLTETARVYFQLKESILTYTSETSLGLYRKSNKTEQMLESDFISLGGAIVSAISELMAKGKLEKQIVMPAIITSEIKREQAAK